MVRDEMEVLVREKWGAMAMYLECCARRKEDVSSVFTKILTFLSQKQARAGSRNNPLRGLTFNRK